MANKALIVNQKGEVLLLRDAGSADHTNIQGRYGCPGGRMDHGETPRDCLLRELQEEVGLMSEDVVVESVVHVDLWGRRGDVVNEPIVGVFYVCRLVGEPEIVLSDEHDDFVWVDMRRSIDLPVTEAMRRAFEAYRAHEGIVVAADASIKGHEGYGMVQVVTGNGKGKTTSAIGQVVRTVGAGKKAAVVFFDKGGEHYMERSVLEQLGVPWFAFGRDRIDPVTGRFDFSVTEEDLQLGRDGLVKARELMEAGEVDLLVLDEINSTTDLGMVSEEEGLALMTSKPEKVELVMTGRNAPDAFMEQAHLVTEMRLRKHYFYSGVKAREGLDF